jgi:hypothetical protein
MPRVVITRLRLRDPALLDDFFAAAVAVLEQAQATDGSVGADALQDADNTWWTATVWQDTAAIAGFVGSDPHLTAMNHLDDWCDEATFVHWDQDGNELPSWQVAWDRIVADGHSADLPAASAANSSRSFPAPVTPST